MNQRCFTTRGRTAALEHAAKELIENGWVYQEDAKIVLLPVPTLDQNGNIKGGGSPDSLPGDCILIGGNITGHPAFQKHKYLDLLQNHLYLTENASITAHCSICIAMENLPVTLQDCPILVAGWGRIGKYLARLLRLLGAKITIAARSEADRALTAAFGYRTMDITSDTMELSEYRVIFNTVPAMVFPAEKLTSCRHDCLKIDLASKPGIDGPDVIWARGLPNSDAPESSGKLIAKLVRKELEQ